VSFAKTLLRNGVHPRRILDLYPDGAEPLGESKAAAFKFLIQEGALPLRNGDCFPVWSGYSLTGSNGFINEMLKQKDRVQEMEIKSAEGLAARLKELPYSPAMVVPVPGSQVEHFAQVLAKAMNLPINNAFKKLSEVSGDFSARKMEWARRSYRLMNQAGISGQTILLAESRASESLSACAELLYARGASCVIGTVIFSKKV
jgi:hypothetical protein